MSTLESEGGFFEQVQGKINPVVVEHYYGHRLEKSNQSFAYLLQVMEAHVVMLTDCKIIPQDVAKKLLEAIEELYGKTPELDPKLEDLYINFESILTSKLGAEVSGYLPVARSRNDVEAAMWRIELREKLFQMSDSILALVDVLHRRAEETADYVFPGYTYRQQAQPVTLGHYLLGIAAALLRDVERVIDCVSRFNYGPLGAAALAGTGYGIDRELTSRLLGFKGVWEHTQDAVASADYMLEAANTAMIHLNTLARFAGDIIQWCATEIGFADLPNDLIDSSSIMPQKRNPVICATVRAHARLVAGRYAGICAAASVEFEASRDVTVAWEDVLECIRIANGMCRISEAYTSGLIFKKDKMENSLFQGFSNATEIADSLVLEGNLSFRAAHKIVGGAIAELFAQGKGQDCLNYELLNSWSIKVTGVSLPISPERVKLAKDFRVGVERRNCVGATSQKEIARMLVGQKEKSRELALTITEVRSQWQAATEELHRKAQVIINC
ncbi:MAG: argininosuccinate lyase [Bacillota bacterium]|jgi:argininosuccinate lyase